MPIKKSQLAQLDALTRANLTPEIDSLKSAAQDASAILPLPNETSASLRQRQCEAVARLDKLCAALTSKIHTVATSCCDV